MKIKFLYGTESGTAEVLSSDMADELQAPYTGSCDDLGVTDIDIFDSGDDIYIFVVATYGDGDHTISAAEFFEDLEDAAPDLSHVKYGVFGLGDTSYEDTYNFASINTDKLLSKLGATRIGDIGQLDASSGDAPEDIGLPWLEKFMASL